MAYTFSGYTERALDHYEHPRNIGDLDPADGSSAVTNTGCADTIRLAVRVRDGIVSEVAIRVYGCGAAIAGASAATELIKGRSVDSAGDLSREDVARELGGLPSMKMHGAALAERAVREAVADYRRNIDSKTSSHEREVQKGKERESLR